MRRYLLLFASALAAAALGTAQAAELPRADPASVGLDASRLNWITRMLQDDVAHHILPGAVLLIARHGKVAYEQAVGQRDPQAAPTMAQNPPMQPNDIFRIYSMSKPITVVAALMLVEQGKIALDDPVSKYLPQFASARVAMVDPNSQVVRSVQPEHPMTIQDLMRHTAGLTYGFFGDTPVKKAYNAANLFQGDFDNAIFVDRLAKLPLAYQPGTTWDYSHSIDVLGRVVEVVSGKSLYQFERENLLDPLGMADTAFDVTDPSKQGRIAEPFPDDRSLGTDLTMNDPRKPQHWQSGGGGMVSTAEDYARFLQMMLSGGTLDGHRYLGPQTVAYMTADQLGSAKPGPYYLPGPGYGFGLGVAVRVDKGVAPFPGDVGDWYWGGAGGTYMWVDPAKDMLVVFMMQSPKQRLHYRPVLRDMVNAAIVD